jgi:hypothetical protein
MMEMAAQSIRRLVVGVADGAGLDPDTRRFDDLHDAFRAAVEWPAVDLVELRYDGPRVTRPFDVMLPSRRVTVRAGTGFHPKVVFRPEVSESVADRRMIRLRNCGLTWEGIPVELRLPDQPSEDWALFQLDRATRVEFMDTVLTVRESPSGNGLPQAASFLRFAEPVDGEMMMDLKGQRDGVPMSGPMSGPMSTPVSTPMQAPTALTLRNCVARGPAQLVRSPVGVPFRLVWQQGLFASTGGLLDLRGAVNQPSPTEVISYELSHVTLAIARPLCSLRLEPDTRFPLEFVGKLTQCALVRTPSHAEANGGDSGAGRSGVASRSVVVPGGDDPVGADAVESGVVLFEQICGPGVEPSRFRPYLSGVENVYPDDTVLLRITQAANPAAIQSYSLRDRHQAREEKWYEELPAASMVKWRKLPQGTSRVEEHSKADYQVELLDGQSAQAGFDPSFLPDP